MYKYFKKVRKELRYLLIVSISVYWAIEFLNNFGEIVNGAHKLGVFFSNLCVSTVSAFIFYFIVVHIKEEKDRENVSEYVGIRVSDIVTTGYLFFTPFSKKSFKDLTLNDLSRTALSAVDKTGTDTNLISNHEPMSWLGYYEHLKKEMLISINVVLSRYSHLDSELIRILSAVEHSLFFDHWNMLYNFQDMTFGMYELQLQAYFLVIKDLEDYSQKHFPNAPHIRGEFFRTNEMLSKRMYAL